MFECNCVCHSDPTKKHCDELSCMPCCTVCQHCGLNIKLGKMVEHLLRDHGIETPKSELDKARDKLTKLLSEH